MAEIHFGRAAMCLLQGKIVLITGANGEIGRACAELFRQRGARLALSDLAPTPPAAIGQDDFYVQADVRDAQSVKRAHIAVVNQFGCIDVAVLAAGIEGPVSRIEDISADDLDEVLAVNVRGSLLWTQHCLRDMKAAASGSIVLLSSISGVVGSSFLGAYTISKHAVLGLMRTAALEAGQSGVRVNAICPGPVQSQMMRRLDTALVAFDPERFSGQADASRALPLHRYVSPREVAAMAVFLGSPEASSCHGGVYMVDGGFTAK